MVLLSALLGWRSALAVDFVARGDRGRLLVTVRNASAGDVSVENASVVLGESPRLRVESVTPGALDIAAGSSSNFTITYSIPTGALDGLFSVPISAAFGTPDVVVEPGSLTADFHADSTPPVPSFVDEQGDPLLDGQGQPVEDGGSVASKTVIVSGEDLGGSGVRQVTVEGPTPFEPVIYQGAEVADTTFEDLADGSYTFTIEDRAGNRASITINVGSDRYPPLLRVRRDNASGEIVGDGGEVDVRPLHIVASDEVLNVSPVQTGLASLSIIGLDPENEFENTLEFAGNESVAFSTSLPPGDYWILAVDRAGNAAEQTFGIIQATGPISTMLVDGYPALYRNFRGEGTSRPSLITVNTSGSVLDAQTGEPVSRGIISFSAFAETVGVDVPAPIVQARVTGGDIDFIRDYAPPQETIVEGLDAPAGEYLAEITDDLGGVTAMPFKLVDLVGYPCQNRTSAFISSSAFSLSGFLCLKSTLGLKSIQESTFNPPFTLLGAPSSISGTNLSHSLSVVAAPDEGRGFVITDVEANSAGFVAGGTLGQVLLSGTGSAGAASVDSEPVDVKAEGLEDSSARLLTAGAMIAFNETPIENFAVNQPTTTWSYAVYLDGTQLFVRTSDDIGSPDPGFSPRASGRNPVLTGTRLTGTPGYVCDVLDPGNGSMCLSGKRLDPYMGSVFGSVTGVRAFVTPQTNGGVNVFAGGPQRVTLPLGLYVDLPAHQAGAIGVGIERREATSRWRPVPDRTAYRVTSSVNTSGQPISLSIPFDSNGLSMSQAANATILYSTVPAPTAGDFLPLPTTVSGGAATAQTTAASFPFGAAFMVVVPVHRDAHIFADADIEFQSDRADVQVSLVTAPSFALRKVLALLASRGILPVSPIYRVGPDGAGFQVPAAIEMAVSDSRLQSAGTPGYSLRILQFNEQGAVTRMPDQTIGAGKVSARVPFLTSNFAVFGDGPPTYSDLSHPKTILSIGGVPAAGGGPISVSLGASLSLGALDPISVSYSSSGVSQTRYLIDEVFIDSVATPGALYVSTFTLGPGAHSLAYYSVDGAGNMETIQNASIYVEFPDVRPPRTALIVGGYSTQTATGLYVSTAAPFSFTVTDDRTALGDGLGTGPVVTYYAIDGGSPTAVSGSFTLSVEGERALSFYSVDASSNVEAPQIRQFFVDRSAPVTQILQNGSTFTLIASDPQVSGAASGVERIRYLLDYSNPAVCNNIPENLAFPPGTCENPWYAGPFSLPSGQRNVHFQAFDLLGNAEILKSTVVTVSTPGGGGGGDESNGGLGIGRDPADSFWSVVRGATDVAFARADAFGTSLSSTTLEDAIEDTPWSVFFDAAGRAYAIGSARGAATQQADVAVYKAVYEGGDVESRFLLDSGYQNNDYVFDAKSPGWLTGGAQVSGAGEEGPFAMALWRFDPVLESVSVSTRYARGGFDVGTGLGVDIDGSVWVAGYSLPPNDPEGRLDLALWHYAANGHTPVGGVYFLPGYVGGMDAGFTARVLVTTAAVYVAAPRARPIESEGYDLVFLRFGKSGGPPTSERLWRSQDGAPSYPTAILSDGANVLVAGGIGDESTQAGLWRFAADGSLLSAHVADAGGANGAVFKGSELWLSVDGSTSPYRVLSEQNAPGQYVDISTPTASLAVVPSSGPIGISFTISGAGFGPYAGANTRVKFGAASAPLSVWNDATITGTIPGISTGVYAVSVERQHVSSLSVVSAGSYLVSALSPSSLSASSGPIGVAFTFLGPGFGAYAGANSRVLFDGTTAALSVWNDARITGTVPGISTGTKAVVVQRSAGAGISTSVEFPFLVSEPSISSVTPSSGPIGTAFTLLGPGFGAYAGANTQVLIEGATAALSVWNDAKIVGTIPGALTPGMKNVVVRRVSGAGISESAPAAFEVTGMSVAQIAPSSGPIGAPFTITGSQFGVYAGANTRVKFGGVAAPLSVWNDTTITGTIPALPAGTADVVVERQQGASVASSTISSFTVLALSISSVTPASGPIGVGFTIKGFGFGPYAGANTRALIGGAVAPLSVWNDTTITGTVPSVPAGSQPVWLERSAGSGVSASATFYFEVTTPFVATLTPSSAPIGAPFTITGANFGTYAGANTRVKFSGVVAPLSVWNDTTITGTVPGALAPGEVELVVERAAGAGLSAGATQAFRVLVPEISTISPSFGPAGTVVTVAGRGFGPYAGANTKLLVGGSTVALSVWNDSTIRWTVPAFLPDGDYPVVVRRTPAGGGVDSASATFTVGSGFGGASFGLSAAQPLAAKPDSHFEGELALSSATGGRIDTPAKAAVDVPPAAMEADTAITLKRLRSDGLRTNAAESLKKRAAGEPIEFGPEGTRFNVPVTIELPYDPALTADEDKVAVHYFNPLRRQWEALTSVVDKVRKVVRAQTDHFSIYQPLGLAPTTAAQDEFYYRDHYAYPNPSRNGALVYFRIQPGLAQTVEVRVYDTAGRKIHDSSDFTFRGAIDDGNGKGAQNTYDHWWNVGGVGSGVYTFVIKASQAGQKPIVKSGKIGVIR